MLNAQATESHFSDRFGVTIICENFCVFSTMSRSIFNVSPGRERIMDFRLERGHWKLAAEAFLINSP